jgi:hypothetical protein
MKVVSKPIEMIAFFDMDGAPRPIRFRMMDEDNNVIKIDRIITMNKEKLAGNEMLVYCCESNIEGIQKIYELKFEIKSCKWILFKI